MSIESIVSSSKFYATFSTLRRWFSNSTTQTILTHDRFLEALGGSFVLLSVVRVLSSNLHASVKFLSFALLFTIVAGVAWAFSTPSRE